uniref:C2H2-type domain-containing protein n=1 Tax=Leersia perrieri TaxID=77586 RepID=A0A0D9X104_9ORYZ
MDPWVYGGSPSKHSDISGSFNVDSMYLASCLMMLANGVRGEARDVSRSGGVKSVDASIVATVKPNQQGYRCSVCGKVYMCYQSLGGHMTIHRKMLSSCRSKPAKVHSCSICFRTFSSGQALGGHVRAHYEGGVVGEVVKKKNVVKTKTTEAPKPMPKDFDLNLPPATTTMGDEAESSAPEAKRARMLSPA